MLVAVAQRSAGPDVVANRRAVTEAVAQAAAAGPVDLVVLPEAIQRDFGPPDEPLAPVAEALDGPFVTALHAGAAATGAIVIAGMLESVGPTPPGQGRQPGRPVPDRPYNTVVAVGPDGLRAAYRKTHLYDAFGTRESDRMSPGPAQACVLDVAGASVGVMTCYDLRFPEQARALVDAGAEVLLVPAAWLRGPDKIEHWQSLLRARAIENCAWVVGAAQGEPHYCGHSMVVDPKGRVVSALGHATDATFRVELAMETVGEVRGLNPALANRRWRVVPAEQSGVSR